MLPLNADDRVRILAATVKKSPGAHALRVVVITASLALLSAPPLFGWVRLDVWGGNHLLLGERVSIFDAIKGFVVALAILYGGTFLSNMIVGRFFCGWGCPVGYVSRLGEETESTRGARRKLGRHLLGAGFVVAFTGATLLWWVDPRVLLDGSVVAKAVVLGVWIVLSLGGFLHAFKWRFTFCLRACPSASCSTNRRRRASSAARASTSARCCSIRRSSASR
jgi:polyferredoxin